MATLKGVGVVWAIGDFTATGVVIAATDMIQSIDLTKTSDKAELVDNDGEVGGAAYYNHKRNLSVSILPSAATIAQAVTNMQSMQPDSGTAVAFTNLDTGLSSAATTVSANYICEESTLRRTNTGAAIVDATLIQYSTDISTTVAA